MRTRFTLTLRVLVVIGCFITVLPLFISVVFADLTLQRVTQTTRMVLEEGFATAAVSTRLHSQALDLERAIWQYQVLKSSALLPIIDNRWQQVGRSIAQLGTLHWNDQLGKEALQLRTDFDRARQAWRSTTTRDPSSSAVDSVKQVQALEGSIETMIGNAHKQISDEANRLHDAARRAQRRAVLSEAGLLPLVVLLGWLSARVITAPLKKLLTAIATLRSGNYEDPISIAFPSEFKWVGSQLDSLRQRLVRLNEDKDRFLHQVSHELKSPLASLRGGVELLDGESMGQLRPAQREIVRIMDESSRELELLINNLLTYGEWRFEQQTAQSDWFDARKLIEEVLATHRLPMADRKLTAKLDVSAVRLYGRREQLRVALDNLVSNAIKHAPLDSAIEVRVGSDSNRFEVSVRDWGCGVPDTEKEAVFEAFWRGAETEEQGVRGTGVGLAIVAETIHAHGGSVDVEDAHPGARFRLVWPGRSA